MEELSAGPLVPAVVKPEASKGAAVAADTSAAASGGTFPASTSEPDKDFLCPICMQIIKDAFLTACGHSFCYMCIITHLRNKSDCPCCGDYLTNTNLFPNFLLDKVRLPSLSSSSPFILLFRNAPFAVKLEFSSCF